MASANWYGKGLVHLTSGDFAWSADHTINCALLSGQYIPDEETDELWGDISAYEAEGTGYTQVTLTGKAVTYYAVPKEIWYSATNNIEYAEITISCRYIAFYVNSGTAETSYLVGWIDLGENKVIAAAPFTFTWSTNGIFRIRKP